MCDAPCPGPLASKPMPRSESQYSNVSDYLDVERSRSFRSALSCREDEKTPGEKKAVKFADSMGLDLCHVRPIFPYNSSDEDLFGTTPPMKVWSSMPLTRPSSIVSACGPLGSNTSISSISSNGPKYSFNPHNITHHVCGNQARYLHLHGPTNHWRDPQSVTKEIIGKAKTNGVCLKTSSVVGMTFSGVILVNNVSFDKKVEVRYTLDNWRSHIDIAARYSTSNNDDTDCFNFTIFLPQSIPIGARVEFCIRYRSGGSEFWDNNSGFNYVLECRSIGSSYSANGSHDDPVFY